MRVLVTGGTGFVGSHAAAALSARGHDVRLLVRSPEKVGPVLEALADAGRVRRAREERGAPVVIVYPGGVWGPHATNLGEPTQGLRFRLGGRVRPIPRGVFPIVDVRDVAAVIAAAVEPGRGPRRYLAFGRYVAAEEVLRILAAATGREIRPLALPASVARA